jgi:hypothetical protein
MEIAERARARRAKEDDAKRLKDEVPALASLSLEVDSVRADGMATEAGYTRRVVVDFAPALFVIPCTEKACEGGGYDLTLEMVAKLRANEATFQGEAKCAGTTPLGPCGRVLRWRATASYDAKAAKKV